MAEDQVEQLRPDTSGHNLTMRTGGCKPIVPKGKNVGQRMSECLVGDQTGIVVCTTRTDQDMANNAYTSNNLRSLLEKEILTGPNFLDWYRILRIVLRLERKDYVLEEPLPEEPLIGSTQAARHIEHSNDASCLMLATMSSDLQKIFENMGAYDTIKQLRTMFQKQARVERFETVQAIFDTKLEEGKPVSPHVLKMISHFENIERLGFPFGQELANDILIHSLPKSYDQFKLNYKMQGVEKNLYELHSMLKVVEVNLERKPKEEVLMVQKGKGFKKKGNGKKIGCQNKDKKVENKKVQTEPKKGPTQDTKCFHCNGNGHWLRNCAKYLEDLKSGKITSNSGIAKK